MALVVSAGESHVYGGRDHDEMPCMRDATRGEQGVGGMDDGARGHCGSTDRRTTSVARRARARSKRTRRSTRARRSARSAPARTTTRAHARKGDGHGRLRLVAALCGAVLFHDALRLRRPHGPWPRRRWPRRSRRSWWSRPTRRARARHVGQGSRVRHGRGVGAGYTKMYGGRDYRFCSRACLDKFEEHPDQYASVAGGAR